MFEFNKETDLDAFNSVPWKEMDVELVQNRENPEYDIIVFLCNFFFFFFFKKVTSIPPQIDG